MLKPRLLTAILFASILLILLVVPMPGSGREFRYVGDTLHVPSFALLGALLFRLFQHRIRRPPIVIALTSLFVVALFALSTEAVQSFVGRQPSWQDVAADLLGGAGGILLTHSLLAESRRQRALCIAAGLICFAIGVAGPLTILADAAIQRAEMPRLASFEHSLELSRWVHGGCHIERVQEKATHGSSSLRVDLQVGIYPGVTLAHPVRDWSGFTECLADVYLSDGPPLDMIVKIQDFEHNQEYHDRFHQTVRLSPGQNTIRVNLDEARRAPRDREMDLKQVATLSLFTVELDAPRTLYLDNVRLE